MKKFFFLLLLCTAHQVVNSQVYNPIVNYALNNTPVNGVKIKTNLPFTNSSQMPTIVLEGYNYGESKTIGLQLVWYVYNNSFYSSSISSYGGYTPEVILSNENGKVVIFINDKKYFNRFTVRGYANNGENPTWFAGWTVVDEALSGSNNKTLEYKNAFAGDVYFQNGIWNKYGRVGIGTNTPLFILDVVGKSSFSDNMKVSGKLEVKEVKVTTTPTADFVFEDNYNLPKLEEIEKHVKEYKHLPEIASAKVMEKEGVNVGEFQIKLLQKIEELTLYSIEQNKKNKEQEQQLKLQSEKIEKLEKMLLEITSKK